MARCTHSEADDQEPRQWDLQPSLGRVVAGQLRLVFVGNYRGLDRYDTAVLDLTVDETREAVHASLSGVSR